MTKMKKRDPNHISTKDLDPDAEILKLAEWVKDTCLMFGASPATAFTVAGTFANGLEKDWRRKRENDN